MTVVTKQRISFEVANDKIIDDLYLPSKASSTLPAVVVAELMTSVKEQVTGVYTKALAGLGFAVLAYDSIH